MPFIKPKKSNHFLLSVLMLMTVSLFLAGCGEGGHRQSAGSIDSDGSFSTPIPLQLEKIPAGSVLTAELVIDGGPPIAMMVNGDNVSVTTPELQAGNHSFTITYFLDGKRIASVSTNATIIAGQSTAITFEISQLDQDLDKDGFTGIDEVIAGTNPDDADSTPNQAPNGLISAPAVDVTITSGESVNFSATVTDPENNTPFTFLWDFGGGATNQIVEDPGLVVFNTPGTFTVTFTATNSLGLADLSPDTRTITVTRAVGKFAYVANNNSNTVTAYTINAATGALTKIGTTDISAGIGPTTVTVHPSGKFAYVANRGSGTVTAYTINATTGALTRIGVTDVAAGSDSAFVTVDPSGKFAYAANFVSSTITAYTINAETGALTRIGPTDIATGSFPRTVTVDPSGKFLYAVSQGSSTVTTYSINAATGALTRIGDTNVAPGLGPRSVTVGPSGKFAYTADQNSNTVTAYTINAVTGVLTKTETNSVSPGVLPVSITVDPSGKFLYTANADSGTATAYTINAVTGALTKVGTTDVVTGGVPVFVAVDPSGKFTYVTNNESNTVTAYTINTVTGALTKIGTTDVATGVRPSSIAITAIQGSNF